MMSRCNRCGARRPFSSMKYKNDFEIVCKRKWMCDTVRRVAQNARVLNSLYVPQLTNRQPVTTGGPWNSL
jgi:hypothetical protein